MKYLEPLILKPEYFEGIEFEINSIFYELIYAPLLRDINQSGLELTNSNDPVADAIRAGKVVFADGLFRGSFNAAISKRFKQLGAKYSIMKKAWIFDVIPAELQIAIADFSSRIHALLNKLIFTLDSAQVEKYVKAQNLSARYDKTVGRMDDAFKKTVESITIAPVLTATAKQLIAKEWATNLELYIVDWTKANILKLRQQVLAHTFTGQRAEPLARMIQKNYQVSRDKAKFLARQETSLLMSKMRESRYKDIGSTKYKWIGADDERERPDHKLLNNKIFSWDSPPVTNRETGARNHPGEDFGCRCVAVPIIEGYNDRR